jgi:hypothetical protein
MGKLGSDDLLQLYQCRTPALNACLCISINDHDEFAIHSPSSTSPPDATKLARATALCSV